MKNSERTSKCQFTVLENQKTKKFKTWSANFRNCQHFCRSWREDPLEENKFSKKVSQCRKNWKGGPFGIARYGMLRGKTGKTFLVQFARPNGAIIFCRTFKNYFGQFVWIEKQVTIIVAFQFMKRRLKKTRRPLYTGIFSTFNWLTTDAQSKICLLDKTQFTSDITSKVRL